MGGEPVAVSAVLPEALGKSEERALILGWAYYLYAFSSYRAYGKRWVAKCGEDNC